MELDQGYIQNLPITDDVQKQLSRISSRKKQIDEIILKAENQAKIIPKIWKSEDDLKGLISDAIKEGEKDLETQELKLFSVKLVESETIHLFNLITSFAEENTFEWKEMMFYNNAYQEFQVRKSEVLTYDAETQTPNPCFLKRQVQTKKILKKEKGSMATEWDMFDTFKKLEKKEEYDRSYENFDEKFYEASQCCQRVLASNRYREEQMIFMTKHQPSRSVKYTLSKLWEMKDENSGEVTCICVNPKNTKIVAVGYGDRGGKGLICCWNSKNPQSPERRLEVESPITSLDFCKSKPNYLGFTTELGEVLIVDITMHKTYVIPLFRATSRITKEPEWASVWIEYDEMGKISERLMTAGHNGEITLWDPETQNHKKLAVLTYTRTPHEDIYCSKANIFYEKGETNFLLRQYICHTIELHPFDHRIYYVTTNEGSILTCKTREVLGEMEILPAHSGAVLGMKHSPFTPDVFLTHGTDYATKIWLKGLQKPLLILETTNLSAILSAEWSPSHSSVLATLSREEFCIWDISRNVLDPMNREERTEPPFFTKSSFTKSGTTIYIGMTDGSVITYRLNDMPHPPYLQVNHLHGAFRKMLSKEKTLLKKISEILKEDVKSE